MTVTIAHVVRTGCCTESQRELRFTGEQRRDLLVGRELSDRGAGTSRRPGPNSNSSCETPKQEQHWRLNRPSPNSSPASARKTLKHGLDSPFALYSKEKYALAQEAIPIEAPS